MSKVNSPQNVIIGPGCATAGYFRLESNGIAGSVMFQGVRRPSLTRRMAVKFLLGWEWIDDPRPGTSVQYATISSELPNVELTGSALLRSPVERRVGGRRP